ncbi:MAG: hypothetical protein HYZ27_10270 [Deltaproteobacteria bacterium]|nr:hypothetical protein [Deltaproteobacteria bacterium]
MRPEVNRNVLVHDADISEFFREAVTSAMQNQGIGASPNVEAYLVGLLAEYLSAERLVSREAFLHKPLCELLAEARGSVPGERVRKLKEIGDTALYVAGYFGDAVEKRGVDLDYYIEMGGGAYGAVASQMRSRTGGCAFDELYGELSDRFPKLVDILGEVSESALGRTNTDVVRLYERWQRTRSVWLSRKLQSHGLFPTPATDLLH